MEIERCFHYSTSGVRTSLESFSETEENLETLSCLLSIWAHKSLRQIWKFELEWAYDEEIISEARRVFALQIFHAFLSFVQMIFRALFFRSASIEKWIYNPRGINLLSFARVEERTTQIDIFANYAIGEKRRMTNKLIFMKASLQQYEKHQEGRLLMWYLMTFSLKAFPSCFHVGWTSFFDKGKVLIKSRLMYTHKFHALKKLSKQSVRARTVSSNALNYSNIYYLNIYAH